MFNPATGAVLAQAPAASAEQLEQALAAAKTAFNSWSQLSYEARQQYLAAYADALQAHRDELARLLTLAQGKPLKTMSEPEVDQSISWLRQIAARRLPVEIVEETEAHVVELHHTPLGVIGAITPWNFPVLLAQWKVAPALITGNTMVIKPSPFTSLSTLRFGQIAQSVLPPGVLAVVAPLFWGAIGNSGQWCVGIKRLYIHRSFHQQFVRAFVDYAKLPKMGDGLDPAVTVGPVQNKMQFDKVFTFRDDIKASGYDNVEDVTARANNSPYGLGGSVWGRDTGAAVAVANRLETGMVWVNELHTQGVDIPFGGHKQSGLGTEHGNEGRQLCTNPKPVLIHKSS